MLCMISLVNSLLPKPQHQPQTPQSLCNIPEWECQPSPGLQPPGLQGCWGPPRLTTQAASSAQPARAGAAGLSPASSHLSGILTRHCEQIPFAWDLSTSEAKESRGGSDQSCLWFIQEQLFAVALEIAVSSPSPGTFIEPGWSNSILAQQTPRSTLPSSQKLKEKTTGGHFWLWLQVLCTPLSNQHYRFSLAWTTKLISKQQANSGRKRGKEEGLFTLLLLQGADVLDKQCMTRIKSTGQRTGGISWCQLPRNDIWQKQCTITLEKEPKIPSKWFCKQIQNTTYTTTSYLFSWQQFWEGQETNCSKGRRVSWGWILWGAEAPSSPEILSWESKPNPEEFQTS